MHELMAPQCSIFPRRHGVGTMMCMLPLALLLLLAAPLHAQTEGLEPVERPSIQSQKIQEKPHLDGFLDEPFWSRAPVAGGFLQQTPFTGEPASQATEVRVVYTAKALYIGFICHDDEPDAIVRRILGRDADVSADDYFTVVLDTYRDRQNGYFFQVNPNGVRLDALFRAEGRADQFNIDWDGVWKTHCRVTESGWQGEIEIPWRTLRFSPADEVSMGLNFERQRRSINEQSQWSLVERQFSIMRVSQAGSLEGLQGISPGANVELRPYLLGRVERGDANDPDAWSEQEWEEDGELGLDAKIGITSNLTLDLTVNTDFAQVEVDDQRVNVTRFPLFFPEKREFFLENKDYFTFGSPANRAFFSRRVGLDNEFNTVPIEYGARLTGKIGRTDVGVLDIKTHGLDEYPDYRFDTFRVSQDFGQSHRIGGIFVSRMAEGGSVYNRVYGLDTDLRPTPDLDIAAYGAFSEESEEGDPYDPPEYGDQPRNGPDRGTWGGRVRYAKPDYYGIYLYEVYGRDYAPRAGFLPRRDVNLQSGEIGWTPQPNGRVVRSLHNLVYGEWYDQRDGTFSSRNFLVQSVAVGPRDENLGVYFSDATERLLYDFQVGDVIFATGDYRFNRVGFEGGTDPSRALTLVIGGEFGEYYDGTLNSWNGQLDLRWKPHLVLSAEGESYRMQRDDAATQSEQRFAADIVRMRLGIDFSNALTLSLFTQWNSSENALLSQAKLHYRFGNESDFYVVFTDARTDNEQNFAPRYGDLTVKLSYAIRL